jgi:hypothetical protein
MARDEVWHSLAENVHHQSPDCQAGARAASMPGVVRAGDGGKPLCGSCAELIRRGDACSRSVA